MRSERPTLNGMSHSDLGRRIKAVFVDTDSVPALDSRIGSLFQNEVEAKLVHQASLTFLNKVHCSRF